MFVTTLETPRSKTSTLLSLAIHATSVALLFTVVTNPQARQHFRYTSKFVGQLIAPSRSLQGGGGGGDRSTLRASKGSPPRAAPHQFVPPMAVVPKESPKLIMEPTLVLPPDLRLPAIQMAQWGDPNGIPGPPSNGTGSGGGIGSGNNGGIGAGDGPGLGPGRNGGTGGGVAQSGGGRFVPAALLWKIEPEYSDEARRAKVQGTVLLALEVDAEGKARNVRLEQGLGLGLDQKAIEAVMRWKFRPGSRNGRPVASSALVEVNFRLL